MIIGRISCLLLFFEKCFDLFYRIEFFIKLKEKLDDNYL